MSHVYPVITGCFRKEADGRALLTLKFQVTRQVLFTPPWWQLAWADTSTIQQAEQAPSYPACKCYNSLHEVHPKDLLFGLKLGRRGKATVFYSYECLLKNLFPSHPHHYPTAFSYVGLTWMMELNVHFGHPLRSPALDYRGTCYLVTPCSPP